MLERMFALVAVALVLGSLYSGLRHWQKRKASNAVKSLRVPEGKVSIVYFSSPGCALCRVSQKPVLERLIADADSDTLELVSVDVETYPDIARDWGVATVPCTCIIDGNGEVRNVNNGLATEHALRKQIYWRTATNKG